MKSIKTFVVILGIAVLGVLGYYFYTSIQELGGEKTDYEFNSAQEITDEFSEIEDFGDSDLILDAELNDLEGLDFEEPITEENIASVIEGAEEEQDSLDNELEELEELDF